DRVLGTRLGLDLVGKAVASRDLVANPGQVRLDGRQLVPRRQDARKLFARRPPRRPLGVRLVDRLLDHRKLDEQLGQLEPAVALRDVPRRGDVPDRVLAQLDPRDGEPAAEAAAATALLLVVALQVHTLDDPDTWWHLASGRLIAAERAVARADPFSFTAPGAPWINRQWLFDLAAYGTWRAGGPAGPILLAAALFTAAFATLYALARRRLPAWGAAALVVLAAQAAVERFTVRPEAATFLLLATYLLVLDRASLGLRALVALVVLQAVWANLHALSVLGLVVLGAELVSAAAARWLPLPAGGRSASRRDARAVARLAAATAAAIAAEAAT